MTGFAPQILTHLKLACLNYVNSPIAYGSQANNERVQFTFDELLTIKENLLKQVQENQEAHRVF